MKKIFSIKLDFDRDVVTITVASTLLLMIDNYHWLTPVKEIDRLGLYFLIPMGYILFAFRKSPKEYGVTWGDWRAGFVITGLAILIIAPILYFVTHADETMQDYYSRQLNALMPFLNLLDLFSWEFFFRGFILFGYARKFGDHALWLQAVPFAMAHVGKPEVETLSTIFGGFLFGLVAWRTRSFLYPFLIHFFVATFTVLVAGGAF